ncbi:MAG: YidB family protein [Leptospira sp.]|nr:YidB family protein [Leptospira sp.]
MSIFESLKAVAAQAVDLVQNNPQIIEGIKKIVEDNGGVSGLVQKFKDKGFTDVASSWVGKGENASIGADDVLKVLGKDSIGDLASKVGMDPESTAGLVSNLLPLVIDKLSPDGNEPKDDVASQLTSLASMFLK